MRDLVDVAVDAVDAVGDETVEKVAHGGGELCDDLGGGAVGGNAAPRFLGGYHALDQALYVFLGKHILN